jgi:hypothetical protein
MKNEIILYRPNELAEHIEVSIDQEKETVWLTQSQIAELLQRDRTVITKHLRNIFSSEELDEKSNVQKMHISNSDKLVKSLSNHGLPFQNWINNWCLEFYS